MATLIKRILKNNNAKRQIRWAYREEREQFERERQNWKSGMSTLMMV